MDNFTEKVKKSTAILPEEQTEYKRGSYKPFPVFKIEHTINKGYNFLAQKIKENIPNGLRVLAVDGYQGINWNLFKGKLNEELKKNSIGVNWFSMEDCFDTEENIRKKMEPFLGGDDPIFGTHYPFGAEIFFDPKKVADFRVEAALSRGNKSGSVKIFYGIGSSLLELHDELWYIDIPKDLIQNLARNGIIKNIGETSQNSFSEFYKRSYFVEWPALNRLKKAVLPSINFLIDFSEPKNPSSIKREDFRKVLHKISESPFRVRPWFFPGPWGGKFMMGHMGLDKNQPNYAWSFELIVQENGITLEQNNNKLEFSFDFLMYQENERVLGKRAAKQFKYEWPIRLDYLDTIDGGNLSTQVHPRPNYIKKNFGETFTQDETYYIAASKPGAKVFLGLKENCDINEFKNALEESIKNETEIDIDKYVYSKSSKPHDLFFIPNGTVHCSGKGNLVLEISAAPYIFTFKIYDYLRRDLEGNLRPINIKRGFENIRPERDEKWVEKNLISKPKLLQEGKDWKEFVLYDKPFSFYNIHRIEFENEYEINTDDRGLAINLVEGEQVELISKNNYLYKLNYLESMVIPAAAKKVKVINKKNTSCKLLLVYVRPEIGLYEPVNNPLD